MRFGRATKVGFIFVDLPSWINLDSVAPSEYESRVSFGTGWVVDVVGISLIVVVGRCRVMPEKFRYFAHFQGRFLVIYRLNSNENLIRSSFAGEPSIVNVSAS